MADTIAARRRRRHRPRVIPVLLVRDGLLYKGIRFRRHKYVGDPLVAVKIFNDKGADELVVLDIGATPSGRRPSFDLIEQIAGECFMPLAYGGGIRTLEDVRTILTLGVEKVVINTAAVEDPSLVTEAARVNGSQSVVAAIDAKLDFLGRYRVVTRAGRRSTKLDPVEWAQRIATAGAGEVLINAVHRDGTFSGYDLRLIGNVARAVSVPVIGSGGAGRTRDLARVVNEGNAAAAAAGSLFVFQMPHRAVLVTFPEDRELRDLFAHVAQKGHVL